MAVRLNGPRCTVNAAVPNGISSWQQHRDILLWLRRYGPDVPVHRPSERKNAHRWCRSRSTRCPVAERSRLGPNFYRAS